MIPEDDARLALEYEDHFVVQPTHGFWSHRDYMAGRPGGRTCQDGFSYSSHTNEWFLTDEEIGELVAMVEADPTVDIPPTPSEPTFVVGG
jgi:UDP-N-acetylglucosamine 4,6-dehydratase